MLEKVAVTGIVKVIFIETIAAAPPQKREPFRAELGEYFWKVGNDR
jgi:hypothetical protein